MSEYQEYADPPTPDLEALQQDDEPQTPPLQVEHAGPVLTHQLPCRISTSRNFSLGLTEPVPLGGRDLRRRRMLLIPDATEFYLGSKQDVLAGNAAIVHNAVRTLELFHCDEVWAMARTAAGTVSVITENWAD